MYTGSDLQLDNIGGRYVLDPSGGCRYGRESRRSNAERRIYGRQLDG